MGNGIGLWKGSEALRWPEWQRSGWRVGHGELVKGHELVKVPD